MVFPLYIAFVGNLSGRSSSARVTLGRDPPNRCNQRGKSPYNKYEAGKTQSIKQTQTLSNWVWHNPKRISVTHRPDGI